MNALLRRPLLIIFILFFAFGCVTPTVWVVDPKVQTRQNSNYDVEFEPVRENTDFFVYFRLSVSNKTNQDLMIDWNKTQYLRNGTPYGVFVFQDIAPDDIRNQTIPEDIVPAGGRFEKMIAPYRLLARAPIRSRTSKKGKIEPGLIPAGRNGIYLVMTQEGDVMIEELQVRINEERGP